MRVSFISLHLNICGGVRRYLELTNHLVKLGHQVTVYHSDGSIPTWMECTASVKPISDVLKVPHEALIHSYPSKEEYDIVQKAEARLKVFYVLHLYEKELMVGFHPTLYWRNEKTLYTKKNIRDADLVLANSTWQHRWIREYLGRENELLLGGVNFDLFHPVEVKKDSGRFRILYTGAPKRWKNTKTVLAALDVLKQKYPNAETDFYYGKNIPQTEMAKFYSSGDIFIDAQWYGGWNNPVAEAMACKVPVVCSRIGAVEDFAFEGETALLFERDNVKELVEKIEMLIQNRDLGRRLAEKAYAVIRAFKWEDSALKLEHILSKHLTHA